MKMAGKMPAIFMQRISQRTGLATLLVAIARQARGALSSALKGLRNSGCMGFVNTAMAAHL
jgi:hypothetical protein